MEKTIEYISQAGIEHISASIAPVIMPSAPWWRASGNNGSPRPRGAKMDFMEEEPMNATKTA